jgi:hypothetical protein
VSGRGAATTMHARCYCPAVAASAILLIASSMIRGPLFSCGSRQTRLCDPGRTSRFDQIPRPGRLISHFGRWCLAQELLETRLRRLKIGKPGEFLQVFPLKDPGHSRHCVPSCGLLRISNAMSRIESASFRTAKINIYSTVRSECIHMCRMLYENPAGANEPSVSELAAGRRAQAALGQARSEMINRTRQTLEPR